MDAQHCCLSSAILIIMTLILSFSLSLSHSFFPWSVSRSLSLSLFSSLYLSSSHSLVLSIFPLLSFVFFISSACLYANSCTNEPNESAVRPCVRNVKKPRIRPKLLQKRNASVRYSRIRFLPSDHFTDTIV